jgi:plasmid maintenance system antidote protein VapI
MEYSLRILPEIRDFLEPLELDEKETLEKLLLIEGCRDPLVVWEEENAILDGHNRYEICKKHGIPYTTIHYSFPDMNAALDWMEENQRGRRNWSKETKKRYIERRLARGDTHQAIAEKVGVTRQRVSQIVKEANNLPSENSDKLQPSLTPTQNLEVIIAERVKKELEARDALERQRKKDAKRRFNVERQKHEEEVEILRQKLEDAKKIDQKVIDDLVASKTAARLAEIEDEKETLERRSAEMQKRHNDIDAELSKRREALESQVASKIREIEKASAVNKDVDELEKERTRLAEELNDLRSRIEGERENAKIREKIRSLEKTAVYQIPTLIFMLKDKVEVSPNACGLTVEELLDLKNLFVSIDSTAVEAANVLDGKIESMRKKGGLQVVR